VEVLALLVSLDGYARADTIEINTLRSRLFDITQNLQPLHEQFTNSFAGSLNEAVDISLQNLTTLDDLAEKPNVTLLDKLRRLRAVIAELRVLFQRATWPMPARVCPVFGLGKGAVRILREDLTGEGTEQRPFLYPPGSSPILNVQAEIYEMVPGGATTAVVTCSAGEKELAQKLPVVEGPSTCSFILAGLLSPVVSLKCIIALKFEARDCSQTAFSQTVYLREHVK